MDTVCVDVMGHLRPDILNALAARMFCKTGSWDIRERVASTPNGAVCRTLTATRTKPSCFVYGENGYFKRAQFELPTIFHGYNGIQIKNQFELSLAIDKVIHLISEIAESTVQLGIIHRLDFAYNLPCDPREVLHELRTIKHPSIQAGPRHHQANGIQFCGRKYTISAYLKTHCSKKRKFPRAKEPSPKEKHLRIEVQAKNKIAVAETFNGGNILTGVIPPYGDLWAGFRKFLMKCAVPTAVLGEVTMTMLLAICEMNNFLLPNGVSALEHWKRGKEPDTIRKELKKIRTFQFSLGRVPLVERIPPEPPAVFLDVYPDRSTHLVRAPEIYLQPVRP